MDAVINETEDCVNSNDEISLQKGGNNSDEEPMKKGGMEEEEKEEHCYNATSKDDEICPSSQLLEENHVGKTANDKNSDVGINKDTGIPIDRGWAWAIVAGCFGMHVIIVGEIKSYGVLYVEFQDKFQAEAWALSAVISLPLALMFGLSLMGNLLAARFSCFVTTFLGSILICVGFFLTAFMPEFGAIVVTFGILTGVGFSLSYGPAIVLVGQHFKKYRSLANGISVSGAGIGAFVIPNLFRFLTKEYGLSGCLLIFAGINLNVAVCAMFFRARKTKGTAGPSTSDSSQSKSNDSDRVLVTTSRESAKKTQQPNGYASNSNHQIGDSSTVVGKEEKLKHLLSEEQNNCEITKTETNYFSSSSSDQIAFHNGNNSHCELEGTSPREDRDSLNGTPGQNQSQKLSIPVGISDVYCISLQALNDLDEYEESLCEQEGGDNCYSLDGGEERGKNPQERKNKVNILPGGKKKLLDWSLFSNPVFLTYSLACFLATPGYANVFNMLPDYAEANGQSRDSAALLTSIIGATDLIGRLFFGWFSDLNIFPKRWGFIGCMAMTGVLNFILPQLTSFAGIVTYAVFFGFFGGSFVTLIAVLLAEDLGIENLASSFGLTMMLMAVAIISGPLVCGSLRDVTGSWDVSFYFVAVLTLVGAVLPLFQPRGQRWVKAREEEKKKKKSGGGM